MPDANDNTPAVPSVYPALAQHQVSEDWRHRGLVAELQRWREVLIAEFKLDVPFVALAVDRLRYDCLGHFRPGHNGFGLRGEIALNALHLRREPWRIVGTLAHELVHAWQDLHGRPSHNHHNREFRDKAASFGLIVDRRGVTCYPPDSPFMALLRRHGVDMPADLPPVPTHRVVAGQGRSKLGKWSCRCDPPVNLRVGRETVNVLCLDCGSQFTREG
jgi:hypothetical protein